MISNLAYINKNSYVSNQVGFRPIYMSGLGATSLYIRSLCHLINTLTSTKSVYQDCDTDKADINTKEKS